MRHDMLFVINSDKNGTFVCSVMAELEEISPKGRPILSDDFVSELISIPKFIPKDSKDPFGLRRDNGHYRSSVMLICGRPEFRFVLSTRKLVKDPLNFSVVFIYKDVNGREYIICRFNGDHGRHYQKDSGKYISGPHIHKITERAQKEYHKDETEAEETDRYKTLEQAIDYAMDLLNIRYESANGTVDITKW